MTDAQLALARRAVACARWWWMRGARELRIDARGTVVGEFAHTDDSGGGLQVSGWRGVEGVPDLDDHATKGCLTALVRRACGRECGPVRSWTLAPRWILAEWGGDMTLIPTFLGAPEYDTEIECLVAALEAGP